MDPPTVKPISPSLAATSLLCKSTQPNCQSLTDIDEQLSLTKLDARIDAVANAFRRDCAMKSGAEEGPSPAGLSPRSDAVASDLQRHAAFRERQYSLSSPPMPWFGIDIGGTLVKLVYFEPSEKVALMNGISAEDFEFQTVAKIHRYLVGNTAYGNTGIRDAHLQIDNVNINNRPGTLHFIRFPSHKMPLFIQMAKEKGFANFASTVCATGGGAHMYEQQVLHELDLNFHKFDELVSLIRGLEFICQLDASECYYWQDPMDSEHCKQIPFGSNSSLLYPFLGVSILSVQDNLNFHRVSGSSLGGGMFFGLCCLLTGCQSFEDALALAEKGDNTNVDKLVRDIYGGDYTLFNLTSNTVAASFGQMIHEEKRLAASKEDLARAALVSITNNIGSIARMCAQNEGIERVLFVGNFLRVNPIAMRMLANAMEFWSSGSMKALFLKHEGYFGAVGCLLELMRHSELRRRQKN